MCYAYMICSYQRQNDNSLLGKIQDISGRLPWLKNVERESERESAIVYEKDRETERKREKIFPSLDSNMLLISLLFIEFMTHSMSKAVPQMAKGERE